MAFFTSIEEVSYRGIQAWRMDSPEGASAVISTRGAHLLSWQPEEGVELIEGYESAEELAAGDEQKSEVMVPWCGPMAQAQYTFAGRIYQLSDHSARASKVRGLDFSRLPISDALGLEAFLEGDEEYPWRLRIRTFFALELSPEGLRHLSLTLEVRNESDTDAPVVLGWNPRLRVPFLETISNASCQVPARSKILSDAHHIPLPGERAFAGISSPMKVDYIGDLELHTAYTDLVPDEDGVVASTLSNPARGATVSLSQEPSEAPVVFVATIPGKRESVALSPRSALPDAFNRADSMARIPLAPRRLRSMTATMSYKRGSNR